ncbi:glycosyltransferase [Micromonospora sp. ATCC 39149]|uniref:Glycosyltransferase family 1 protein n=1 Tax=Micromonospora carbonacea TaxID=47853 RepID=A0A7D6CAY6_9ACTN|nr:glycosyltransferase [Micromonospora sp. ATCC 39149]QLJ99542.1 glycosyltransferase family 1 protein [Micromonospora carbonacea]
MRVLVYAYGTRGDVQPYLALAYALHREGHQAVLAAPARFRSLAEQYGVGFAPRDDEWLGILNDPDVRRILERGGFRGGLDSSRRKQVQQRLRTEFSRLLPKILDDTWAAAGGGADLVVHSQEFVDQGQQVAEALGVPAVLALLHPYVVPSWQYPSALFRFDAKLPGVVKRLSYVPLRFLRLETATVQRWRSERLGLPPRRGQYDMLRQPDGSRTTVLHGFSRHLVAPASDWPSGVHTTGFWLLPSEGRWSPPDPLVRFLDSGPPPVFVGFGSLSGDDPRRMGEIVVAAVRNLGVRAVVSGGWDSIRIDVPPDDVFVLDQAPFDWLLPRLRLAVHAGSAGVANEALAAGIPHVSCPMHREQELWGDQLHRLGLAPPPIRQRDLTADNLTAAMRTALRDVDMAERARQVREQVRAEDGARAAVRILEHVHAERSVRR